MGLLLSLHFQLFPAQRPALWCDLLQLYILGPINLGTILGTTFRPYKLGTITFWRNTTTIVTSTVFARLAVWAKSGIHLNGAR